jgi:hypothetical protein
MFEALLTSKHRFAPGAYKYWRFDIVGISNAAILLPEVKLISPQGDVITQGYKDNATAIGSYSASYLPSKAFDGIVPQNKDELSHWQFNGGTRNSWIQIWIPAPRDIAEYSIYMPLDNKYPPSNSFQAYAPASWVLSGSLDGTTWFPIDSQSGYTSAKWLEKVQHRFII